MSGAQRTPAPTQRNDLRRQIALSPAAPLPDRGRTATVMSVLPSPSNSRQPPSGPFRPGLSALRVRVHDDRPPLIWRRPRSSAGKVGYVDPEAADPRRRRDRERQSEPGSAARMSGGTLDRPQPPVDWSRRLPRPVLLFHRCLRQAAALRQPGATSATSAERQVVTWPMTILPTGGCPVGRILQGNRCAPASTRGS